MNKAGRNHSESSGLNCLLKQGHPTAIQVELPVVQFLSISAEQGQFKHTGMKVQSFKKAAT